MLEIRAMQAEDLEAVARTESQIFSRPWSRKGFEDALRQKEKFRGKGVATELLEQLFLRGYERGIENFTLEVRVGNAPAIHLYEKLGVERSGIRPNFYEKPKEDALIMWKYGNH